MGALETKQLIKYLAKREAINKKKLYKKSRSKIAYLRNMQNGAYFHQGLPIKLPSERS